MSYIDSITDALLNVHLFEMAAQRKDITNRAHALNMQIARHIVKIALYPEHSARKHWENEIYTWCTIINDMKFDRIKKLKSDQYFDILYKIPFEHTDYVTDVSKSAVQNDNMPNLKWTSNHIQDLEKRIELVYKDLCMQIATNKFKHIGYTLKDHGI